MKKIIVVDIDGTIADCTHRRHHVTEKKKNWTAFFEAMDHDTPRLDVWKRVLADVKKHDAKVTFVSARPENYRQATQDWLKENSMEYEALIMRPEDDTRPDTEIKNEIYHGYLKRHVIIKVYDDRPKVIQMWRDLGLEVEDVGDGVDF